MRFRWIEWLCQVAARTICIAALACIPLFGFVIADAEAQITCTGVPHDQGNFDVQDWYFDLDTGTCASDNAGGAQPANGWMLRTDDDDYYLDEVFNNSLTTDVCANSSCSAGPYQGLTALNITPGISDTHINDEAIATGLGVGSVEFDGVTNVTFNFVMTLTFQGDDYTINTTLIATDGSNHEVTAMTVTGGKFIPTTTDTGAQASSQAATGSNVMFQGASQNISTGIGNAIAERFFDGGGSSFNVGSDGSTLNAYVSVRGIGQAAQDMRSSRLAMYDAPEAVRAIYEATGGVEAGVDAGLGGAAGEEVSPYLLGADVVPYVPASPEPTTWNAWVRGTYTHYDGDAFSGDTWNGIAGMDYLITDSVLVGVLAGYENGDFDFDTTNGAFEGAGFTAGVYVGARLSPSIVADAFLTHSWLDYDTRSGTATGSTDASRWLVSMNVTGSYDLSDTLILEPNVRVFYAHENQDGYTLSDATVVAANTIDSGRLSLGPRLRYLVAEDWTAFISAHGEYDLSSEDQTNSTLPDFDGLLSARIGLGVDGTFWNGWSLSLAGDVSGIGSGDYLAYTGTGKIRVPLN